MSRLKTLLLPLSSLQHAALLVPALIVTNVLLSICQFTGDNVPGVYT